MLKAHTVFFIGAVWGSCLLADAPKPYPCISGVYPHLAAFNNERTCGIGAIAPWAGKLWMTTSTDYSIRGSSDKLYEISSNLACAVRSESIGGTAVNRLIHSESKQLFIGPYIVSALGQVRSLPSSKMQGRIVSTMRHLSNPASKIIYSTMEEGFYEVNLRSLIVRELFPDANHQNNKAGDLLPGAHGQASYSGQGRIVYASNGDLFGDSYNNDPLHSGVLAEWNGRKWSVVRRNQFTDVTGPGDIFGSDHPESDPLWAIGYDSRSCVLMLLDRGAWHMYRFPKSSHTYDGIRGETACWPRLREIVRTNDFLMVSHGMFWSFPRSFSAKAARGIRPLSSHLRVVSDFCLWESNLVFACDDTPHALLSQRTMAGGLKEPGQANSNLWFVDPAALGSFGPVLAHGAVWMGDEIFRRAPCFPYLFEGFEKRGASLSHCAEVPVDFSFEIDEKGDDVWRPLETVTVPPHRTVYHAFAKDAPGVWIRVTPSASVTNAYTVFHYANPDTRAEAPAPIFKGLSPLAATNALGGLVFCRGGNRRTLGLVAETFRNGSGRADGFYELDGSLALKPCADLPAYTNAIRDYAVANAGFSHDSASIVVTDSLKRRWRLPSARADYPSPISRAFVDERRAREVCAGRTLVNAGGLFYEVPDTDSGGFGRMRALAAHDFAIRDFCSWRGLLILSGIDPAAASSTHVIRSSDGRAALWAGAVDDLWSIGKPRGEGGVWKHSAVEADTLSDPFLLCGFDRKRLSLSQTGASKASFDIELDIAGNGAWAVWKHLDLQDGETVVLDGEEARALDGAYWVRFRASTACTATAWLVYN